MPTSRSSTPPSLSRRTLLTLSAQTGFALIARGSAWAMPVDPSIKVTENIWIPMPDGVKLAARLFLPADADTKPCGVVIEYLPYRKRDAYRYRDDIAGPALASHGIGLIRVDIRGTGDSDGMIDDEYMPPEEADALSLMDWLTKQPWCNGNIGMRGISYGSFNGLQAAAKAPAALKAIVSACGTEQRYEDDIHYRGGCLIQSQLDWGMEWQVIMRAPPDPAIVGKARWETLWHERLVATRPITAAWTTHQTRDEKWRYGSIDEYSTLNCAMFHVAGMLDSYVNSASRLMEQRPDLPQKALIGPWTHKWPGYPDPPGHHGAPSPVANGVPGPGVDWLPVEARWWRHWLLGEANGIMDEPRIWAFQESGAPGLSFPQDTPGQFVSEPSWPSKDITEKRLFLSQNGLADSAGTAALRACPASLLVGFATPATYSSGDPASWWREQSGDDALSLVFDSEPLATPFDLMGRPRFRVRVRADRRIAKLFIRLNEVTPDGQSHEVSNAVLNLTHRLGDSDPKPLEPGQDYDVDLTGLFACHRFAGGSRIRVALSESWWPVTWPSPEPVILQVTTGLSWADLPERRAQDPIAPSFTVLKERYAESGLSPSPYHDRLHQVSVTGDAGSRVYSLVSGSKEIELSPIPDANAELGDAFYARRSIREDDPNSAEWEAECTSQFRNPFYDVKLRAWCLLRSTPTQFLIEETFEAWRDGKPVATRKWRREIARRMV